MEFTKEQLIARINQVTAINKYRISRDPDADGLAMDNELFAIALASLEAEAVAWMWERDGKRDVDMDNPDEGINRIGAKKAMDAGWKCNPLYTAPPAPARSEPIAWLWSHRKHPSEVTLVRPEDDERAEGAHWSGWSCQALYAAQPAPVSVPDERYQHLSEIYHAQEKRLFKLAQRIKGPSFDKYAHSPSQAIDVLESAIFGECEDEACRAAMLQGAEPVTTKDDGGRYEQDDSPECGWVVTHSGKDYFYREQKDAVTHMNAALESGRGVSLRSLISEPVSEPHKLNDPVILDSYEIERFGIFSATECESGLLLQIEQFLFGTENCPQIGKENMVPKFALQAIINRLQAHCNSMGEDTLIDIFASSAAPQQEVKP